MPSDDQNDTYFGIAEPCAFLERGPDAEVYVTSPHDYDERRLKKVGTAPNWWCTWGHGADAHSMPAWLWKEAKCGRFFRGPQDCKNCPCYAPLTVEIEGD